MGPICQVEPQSRSDSSQRLPETTPEKKLPLSRPAQTVAKSGAGLRRSTQPSAVLYARRRPLLPLSTVLCANFLESRLPAHKRHVGCVFLVSTHLPTPTIVGGFFLQLCETVGMLWPQTKGERTTHHFSQKDTLSIVPQIREPNPASCCDSILGQSQELIWSPKA